MSNLTNSTYRALRNLIVRCELHPGELVTANELQEKLGVGRAPMREALTRVSGEGLLINRPRRGYEVVPITLDDVRSLFEVRRIVEPEVGALVCRSASDEEIDQIVALAKYRGPTPPDYQATASGEFMETNRDFHRAIAQACGNPRLSSFALKLIDDGQRLNYFQALTGNMAASCISEHHLDLANAFSKRDEGAVRQLTLDQTIETEQHLVEMFMGENLLGSVNVGVLATGRAAT